MSWQAIAAGVGALYQNQEAKRAAKRQMEFQASMSNTSWQRGMADMKAAGLNPMLAYKMGGASSPAGAMYTPQNVGMAATDGYLKGAQANQANAQVGLTNEQKNKIVAEIEQIIPMQAEKMRQEGLLAQAGISLKEVEAKLKEMAIQLTQMDIDGLEKLGLSPMQLKHSPINQIGSILIDRLMDRAKSNPSILNKDGTEILQELMR